MYPVFAIIALYGVDKYASGFPSGVQRIPNYVLKLAAVVSPAGAITGMLFFRHKTNEPQYYVAVTAGAFIWLAYFAWSLYQIVFDKKSDTVL